MGQQEIIDRIVADAEAEAANMIADAEKVADAVRAESEAEAEKLVSATQVEIAARAKAIADGKASAARLDGAKILLAEKRRVLDSVYTRAYEKLLALPEKECLALYATLLQKYAEEGDEVVLSARFRYATELSKLPVVAEKKLKLTANGAFDGGFVLHGKYADTDLTFLAILERDKEKSQAEISKRIFG